VRIAKGLLDSILAHARSGYPDEVCGVLMGSPASARVEQVIPVQNRETESPRVRYQIAPEDLLRIQRDGLAGGQDILGYYHSHPDHPARPSETDRRTAAEGLSDGVIHVVVGVENGDGVKATAWVFRDASASFEEETLQLE